MNPTIGIAGLVVFYIVISFAFAKITQHGFRTMEGQNGRTFKRGRHATIRIV